MQAVDVPEMMRAVVLTSSVEDYVISAAAADERAAGGEDL